MKRSLKQFVKSAAALGLAAVMMVAAAGPVFATGVKPEEVIGFKPEGNAADAAPVITKRIRVPEGVDIPAGLEFTFHITALGASGAKDADEAKQVVSLLNTPSLSPVTITHPGATSASISANKESNNDPFRYADKLSDAILTNADFTRVGLYIYSVTENAGSDSSITYSKAKYKMRVYVDNTSDRGLAVKLVTFHRVADDNGAPDTSEEKVDKVIFRNTYNTSTEFEISTSADGAYADKTKRFEYNMTLQKAPGLAADQGLQYTAKVYRRSGDSAAAPYDEDTGVSYNFSTNGTPTTFYLAHNEKLIFEPIAVGTKYTLTEVKNTDYTASAVVYDGAGRIGTVTATDSNDTVIGANGVGNTYTYSSGRSGELEKPILLTQKGQANNINKIEWTNTYIDPPTPTGIIMNNLPFIVLILIALAGFTGYIVMKRKSRRDQ